MFAIGTLGFLQPLFLIGLVALPLLWLLLRATPPRPRTERFPGVRVLLGLDDRESTPQRTPWWLLLLRLMIAAVRATQRAANRRNLPAAIVLMKPTMPRLRWLT